MKRSMLLAWVLVAVIARPLAAQSLSDLERVLLPLGADRIKGAFGSEWVTNVVVTNMSDTPIQVFGYTPGTCAALCVAPPIQPHTTVFITNTTRPKDVRGSFLSVKRGRAADLAITLRVQDLSRQSQTWGTVIPVVRPSGLFGTRFGLVDVPLDPQFRALLRIYDADATTAASVRIRVYAVDPQRPDIDALLLEKTMTFTVESGGEIFHPGYIEVPLWAEPALAGARRVRIEIEPLTATPDFWAFVSITHNDTQHVTVITPQ